MRSLSAALRAFRADRRAVSAVEFALILPVMLLLWIGAIELTTALTVDRKVNSVAATIGDLVAQYQTLDRDTLDDIFAASAAILTPFDASGVSIVVASVDVSSGTGKVVWGAALHGSAPGPGAASPVPIPAELASGSTQLVVTRVTHRYESPVSDIFASLTGRSGYDLAHDYLIRPRVGSAVTLK